MKLLAKTGLVILVIFLASSCMDNPVINTLLSSKGGALVRMVPPPGREYTPHGERCTGYPFHALMQNLDQWENTRSTIDYFEYQGWILNQGQFFSDSELIEYFAEINTWNCKFSIGSYCLKAEPTPRYTAEEAFWTWCYPRWIRFEGLGAQIDELTIDESFTATRLPGWQGPPGDDYAVQETAEWIYLVRTEFDPNIEICSIESYPEFFSIEELIWWIDELNAACDELGVDGIQSFSLDVNWNMISSWNEVVKLERLCQKRGVKFELIYWPAPHWYPEAEDIDFYNDIHFQGRQYQSAGGAPDVYTIQSWNWIPRQTVPETQKWTYTFSFQSFVRTFVPK